MLQVPSYSIQDADICSDFGAGERTDATYVLSVKTTSDSKRHLGLFSPHEVSATDTKKGQVNSSAVACHQQLLVSYSEDED